MVVAKCKMRYADFARLNAEKPKNSLRFGINIVAETNNLLKTHNKPNERLATLLSTSD
jgi:hypothetical protein